jgi:hypothetical protein
MRTWTVSTLFPPEVGEAGLEPGLESRRVEYTRASVDAADLDPEPVKQFLARLTEAGEAGIRAPP